MRAQLAAPPPPPLSDAEAAEAAAGSCCCLCVYESHPTEYGTEHIGQHTATSRQSTMIPMKTCNSVTFYFMKNSFSDISTLAGSGFYQI